MNFRLDALASWEGVVPGETLMFEAIEPRRIRLAFLANGPTEVWASYPVEPVQQVPSGDEVINHESDMRDVLVAFGSGVFETEFTTHGATFVRVLADEETSVFIRGYAPDMRVAESESETFTTLMPRERRNTEFDRMVMWTKLNEARREAQLAEAIAALKAQAATATEPVAATEPPPAKGDGE